MPKSSRLAAAVVAALLPCALRAAPVVVYNDRQTVQWMSAGCGAVTEWKQDDQGSHDVVYGPEPGPHLQGSGNLVGQNIVWSCTYDYDLPEQYALEGDGLAASALAGAGAVTLDIDGPSTHAVDAVNSQVLEFSVSAPAPYHLTGGVHGGEIFGLRRWDPSQHQWLAVFADRVETDFDETGTLAAGRYRTLTSPYTFTADGAPPRVDATWSFRFDFTTAATKTVRCGDFQGVAPGTALGSRFKAGPITLRRTDGSATSVQAGFDAAGTRLQGALVGPGTTVASAPATGSQVMLWLTPTGGPVGIVAKNAAGRQVASTSAAADGTLQFVVLDAAPGAIATVEIAGGDGGTILNAICGRL